LKVIHPMEPSRCASIFSQGDMDMGQTVDADGDNHHKGRVVRALSPWHGLCVRGKI
jgi:hypothetical protein